jgi:5-methylcytosine-specific restriction protein B
MNGSIAEREALWDDFLNRWPLEDLPAMQLEKYSQLGGQDGFTYWLEAKTEGIGSVWGGSSFKFGVYIRKDKSQQKNARGKCYDDNYGWLSKYGKTPQDAFAKVHGEIVRVAQAARAGRLSEIDSIDLGNAIKWKIAFLYQDRSKPSIVPIFKADYLRVALANREKQISKLHEMLMQEAAGKSILAYGDAVWTRIQPLIRTELSAKQALEYFEQSERFGAIKPPNQKMAGFASGEGRQLALALDNIKTTLYLSDGDWLSQVRPLLQEEDHYGPIRSRSSNLAANAPQLAVGNPIVKVVVPNMEALIALCDAYEDYEEVLIQEEQRTMSSETNNTVQPLNQILFGPPGTGKTYSTIDATLAVLDPTFLSTHCQDRGALKSRFDALAEQGQIRFVTFHQSCSYEDFVEGLRAQSNEDGQIEYRVEDGIFKQLCDAARTWATRQQRPEIAGNPRIWKISIDGTGTSPIRQYCLTHGEARIGWGDTGDLREGRQGNAYLDSLGTNDRNTLHAFTEEIAVGDILVCIDSATEIGAVGVVRGSYWYDGTATTAMGDRQHVLPINWLYKGLKISILPLNDNKQFTQKTVYPLDRFGWGDLLAHLEKSGALPVEPVQETNIRREPHVLVIDEINRGNVSRIFGELITLIEPSKREGHLEALSVQLPYSKRPFSVPDNVYLIGTMNTADRSLAGLDIALRRRFDFVEMPPRPALLDGLEVAGVNIGKLLRVMNERIEVLLDRDHCLGHAYFIPLKDDKTLSALARIFRANILPLLQEYFFEDWQRIQWVLNDHRKPQAQHRFLIQPATNLAVLFGDKVPVNEHGLRWSLNDAAFGLPESYAGVISAGGDGNA